MTWIVHDICSSLPLAEVPKDVHKILARFAQDVSYGVSSRTATDAVSVSPWATRVRRPARTAHPPRAASPTRREGDGQRAGAPQRGRRHGARRRPRRGGTGPVSPVVACRAAGSPSPQRACHAAAVAGTRDIFDTFFLLLSRTCAVKLYPRNGHVQVPVRVAETAYRGNRVGYATAAMGYVSLWQCGWARENRAAPDRSL